MKTFNVILAIGAAAIGISGVMAKAVPQECKSQDPTLDLEMQQSMLTTPLDIELPASILKTALAKRDVERLVPCWKAPDDSIRCPVVKRDANGGRCFSFVGGKQCCPVSNRFSSSQCDTSCSTP